MKKLSLLALIAVFGMVAFSSCKNEKATDTPAEETEVTQTVPADQPLGNVQVNGERYSIDSNSGQISWFASKVGGQHNGTIAIKEGVLGVDNGQITGGSFIIDMSTIDVRDLDGEWKMKLENHLKGLDEGKEDHFFNVAKYPTARFDITKVTDLEGNENANKMVYGDLTIKGITNPVGMTAMVTIDESGTIHVQANKISLDRTKWNVNYNSKKIFADLQDNIIHDEFKLDFEFKATKA